VNSPGCWNVQKGRWFNVADFNQHIRFDSKGVVRTPDTRLCARFEAMLADAVDGSLPPEDQAAFDQHLLDCTACSTTFADAQRGAAWLEMLRAHQPEPAADLLARIFAQTSGQTSSVQEAQTEVQTATGAEEFPRLRPTDLNPGVSTLLPRHGTRSPSIASPINPIPTNILPFRRHFALPLEPFRRTLLQPRLAMTAAMAFFSVAVTLNLAGIRITELRASDLRPSSLKRPFYEADAHIARYYDNLRVVYELESRVHDLQRPAAVDRPMAEPADIPAPRRSGPQAQPATPETDPGANQSPEKQLRPHPKPGTSQREPIVPDRRVTAAIHQLEPVPPYLSAPLSTIEPRPTHEEGSGMNPQPPPDQNTVAFCQNCGKPLTAEERRIVGQAVFCEPCLAERLAASAPPPNGPRPNTPGTGYSAAPSIPPGSAPNPGLAALLGFIPGVGAMYNGQYAKGVVHLIVFAILVSLSDQHGIFGLFIAGWVFYQVIEAYHTAQARRDWTPLPNPFGLNDLAERLGFGRSWPNASATAPSGTPNYSSTPPVSPPAGAQAPPPAYDWEGHAWEQATGNRASQAGQTAPGSYAVPPFGPPNVPPRYAPLQTPYSPQSNRFPTGALWLIALGILFLIGNVNIFRGFPVHHLLPFLLIGGGVWLFIHRMTSSGAGITPDGSPAYRGRLFYALRGSVWIILTGVLFFLDITHILSWGRSWPLWIILAGVMTLLQRTLVPAPQMPGPYAGSSSYPPTVPPSTSTPSDPGVATPTHDQEGRQI
jgi:hypothetical protein